MSSLLQVIALNNEGANQLQNGRVGASLRAFQQAIAILKECSAAVEEGNCSLPIHHDGGISGTDHSFALHGKPSGLRDNYFFIYMRPLLLATSLRLECHDDLESFVHFASSTVLFNMALSWHLKGIKETATMDLTKAGKLYDLLLMILDDSVMDDHLCDVIKCLVLNNRAHLLFEQCIYQECSQSLDDMCDLLMSSECIESLIGVEESNEFMLNAAFVQPPSIAAAA